MRILAASDIHLGRRPRHGNSGHDSWDLVVNKALELAVDVLVLAGDVIEHERAWLSVYAPLVNGLRRLGEANIRVIAVAGNHDWEVFSRLTAEAEQIKILGLGGTWESCDVEGVRFVGWSFARSHHEQNPFTTFSAVGDDCPLSLGLLHTDFGASASRYAPTTAQDYDASGVGLWVLGHIHAGGPVADGSAFYCGSPYALDSGEGGPHGAWLIEDASPLMWKEPCFIPLSPVRYEEVALTVTDLDEIEEIRSALRKSARAVADGLDWEGELYLTIRFVGSLAVGLSLSEVMGSPEEEVSFPAKDGITCYVQRSFSDQTTPAIDLAQLESGSGADSQLARLLSDEQL
ncbi:MAG: DNA repair exonuclease, partial [Spirochaetales bacterium]|nr:DNA repair exonuclease [Spirochaetales bacterium]